MSLGCKVVRPAWDMNTLRGRARLGAALVSGSIAGIAWHITLHELGEIDVLSGLRHRRGRSAAIGKGPARVEATLRAALRLVQGLSSDSSPYGGIGTLMEAYRVTAPPILIAVSGQALRVKESLQTELSFLCLQGRAPKVCVWKGADSSEHHHQRFWLEYTSSVGME